MTENATQLLHCPECGDTHWPAKTRGLRTCEQCGTVVKLTRQGVKVHHGPQLRRDGKASTFRTAREYRVINPADGTVLCAVCALPVMFSQTMDGRAGHIRGRICPTCVVKRGAVPVGRMLVDTRPLSVSSPKWNTREQRLEADRGLIATYRALRNGALSPEEATALIGANWAHTGDAGALVAASHPSMCACPRCLEREPSSVAPAWRRPYLHVSVGTGCIAVQLGRRPRFTTGQLTRLYTPVQRLAVPTIGPRGKARTLPLVGDRLRLSGETREIGGCRRFVTHGVPE